MAHVRAAWLALLSLWLAGACDPQAVAPYGEAGPTGTFSPGGCSFRFRL
jgi:hypothetical protein